MSTMQRNSRKLTDVFDGAIPGEAVVQIRHYAQVDAVHARLFEHVLNDAALAWRGEEYLVDELLASMLEERVERADDIAACWT